MGKAACPKCRKVFDSEIEYRVHWSHNHPGSSPAPLTQPTLATPLSSTEDPYTPVDASVRAPIDTTSQTQAEEAYSLSASKAGLGELSPVLKDAFGNIIDGFHRKGENANWHEVTVSSIDNPVKLELARLAVNFCRRKVQPEELRERITFLVKNGLKAEEIAKATGITDRTVRKYMPQEYKNPVKVEAAQLSNEARKISAEAVPHTVKISDIAPSTAIREPAYTPMHSVHQVEEVEKVEEEPIPEGTPLCPCCGASMNLSEFEEVKQAVAVKYGKQIQTLLFSPYKA